MADLPGVIAQSWHRVSSAGLDPASCLHTTSVTEVDLATPLLTAADPVLAELAADLRGARCSALLVDRDCRVVWRWCDDRRTEAGFDDVGITVGASLLEDDIGTNAPGTAHAARRSVTVNGEEHFAEPLRAFSCDAHPIRHPLTRRVEGVLDVSVLASRANPLLRPLIARAARDVEQRLLDGSRGSERHLMLAFRSAAAKSRRAVVALGDDLVATNRHAQDLLGPADLTLLQVLVDEPPRRDRSAHELRLASGTPVLVEVERVPGAPGAALVRIALRHERDARPARSAGRAPDAAVLVAGAPGTGRTTRARERAGARPPVQVLPSSLALLEGPSAWARRFAAAAARRGTVVVDGVDQLPAELVGLVRDAMSDAEPPALVLTSGPVAELTGQAAALAAAVPVHDELVPLAVRRHEVPDLAAAMLREIRPEGRLHLAPSLQKALAGRPWPGNLHELRSVVATLATRRSAGALTVDDLPARYRTPADDVRLNARDRAERDVILAVLREVDGNKVRAAERLCMSRTTLYARLRTLRIDG